MACAVSITAYRDIFRNIGGAIYTVALTVVCLLLFNSFYLAFVGLGLGLAINALLESLPDDTTPKNEYGYKRLGLIKGLLRYEFLAAAFIRFPEFSGRLTETGSPIEGPLDQVVAYIHCQLRAPRRSRNRGKR